MHLRMIGSDMNCSIGILSDRSQNYWLFGKLKDRNNSSPPRSLADIYARKWEVPKKAHTWLSYHEAEQLLEACYRRPSGKKEFEIYTLRD